MAERKVLLTYQTSTDAKTLDHLRVCRGWLGRMGYTVDEMVAELDSDFADSFSTTGNGYEFIVWVRIQTGIFASDKTATLLDGTAKIPTFITMPLDDSGSTANQTIGVNRTKSYSGNYKYCTHTAKGLTIPVETAEWQVTAGFESRLEVVMVVDDPETTTPEPGYDPGKAVFSVAKIKGANYPTSGTIVYFEGGGTIGANLPLIMQEAIDDGLIEPPTYKLLGNFDNDDIPDPNHTLSDIQQTMELQEQYGIPSTWGIDPVEWAALDQTIADYIISKNAVDGGLMYPIEHEGNTYWDDTYANIDSFYTSHVSSIQSNGLRLGYNADGLDSFGYHYFNTNAFNDDGAKVASQYGMKVCRLSTGFQAGSGTYPDKYIGIQAEGGHSFEWHRDMLLVNGVNAIGSGDVNLDPVADLDEFAQELSLWYQDCLAHGAVLYMHGGNFYDGHDGGNAPGFQVLRNIGDMQILCKDLCKHAFPTELYDAAIRDSVNEKDTERATNTPFNVRKAVR